MKEKINAFEAEKRLLDTLKDDDFQDRIYEFAQECFQRGIAKVEEKAIVVDADGEPWSDGNDGECTWYDWIWQGFFDACYQALYNFIKTDYEDS